MGSVQWDVITRNLGDTIENLDYLEKQGFTDFLATVLFDVFDAVKERALDIIETGEPSSEIPHNIGAYANIKSAGLAIYSYDRGIYITGYGGISHGLGILTGDLYNGVRDQAMGEVKVTRGKEVRIGTNFDNPDYIGDVHSGKPGTLARPFLDVATRNVEVILTEAVENYLREMQIVSPPPQFISSLIVRNVLGNLSVH